MPKNKKPNKVVKGNKKVDLTAETVCDFLETHGNHKFAANLSLPLLKRFKRAAAIMHAELDMCTSDKTEQVIGGTKSALNTKIRKLTNERPTPSPIGQH